jgi:thiamine biosynthesis lipoprotein
MRASVILILFLLSSSCFAQQPYKRTLKLMGSCFDITVVAKDSVLANTYIDIAVAEIERIEKTDVFLGRKLSNFQNKQIRRN